MKQKYIHLSFIVAAIAMLAVSCQKEEGTVTLGAKIQQPVNGNSKLYIEDYTPYWHNGDEVFINNATYPVFAASGSSAQIENVVESSTYRAIYPASIVVDDYIPNGNINNSEVIPINLPAEQNYQASGEYVKTEVPMGAYLTSGDCLEFFNLCSIVRVRVSNSLTTSLDISSIVLRAQNARLSGAGTATVNGQSSNCITMSTNASHEVTYNFPDNPAHIEAQLTGPSWDIVVPEFSTDNITIIVNTVDGQYFELTKNNVSLNHNTITTVTVNVTELNDPIAAELVDGTTFNSSIPTSATSVVFEYNSTVTSGTATLSTSTSPYPIYGNLDGNVWKVSTPASRINANTDCSNMFNDKNNVVSIEFGTYFNTSNTTDMHNMFSGCNNLSILDVSHFNTSNVTDMGGLFRECVALTAIDVSHFNTSNVTDMSWMFAECAGLYNIDVSHFNTFNVTDMSFMFGGFILGCQNLTSLDLSNFNTSNVTSMRQMFFRCSGLTSLNISNFNTESVTNMQNMFGGCMSLTSLDLSSFNTSNVSDMGYMFQACNNLTNLNLYSFNTSNVTTMTRMFANCQRLSNILWSETNFNTSNVTSMSEMFLGCSSINYLNLYNFNTSNVVNMSSMFEGCSNLSELLIYNFNTSNVTNMKAMFKNCSSLTNLRIDNFDMSHLTVGVEGESSSGKYQMCTGLSTYSHYCTITCPLAVETAMSSGTDLPTSGVTFTWVRPSSK